MSVEDSASVFSMAQPFGAIRNRWLYFAGSCESVYHDNKEVDIFYAPAFECWGEVLESLNATTVGPYLQLLLRNARGNMAHFFEKLKWFCFSKVEVH